MPNTPPRRVPGRGSPRPGTRREQRLTTGRAPASGGAASDQTGTPAAGASSPAPARGRTVSTLAISLTQRIIALVATVAVLVISFVSSFSVYLGQQKDIAAVKAEIADHQSEIGRLQDELGRWSDPAYVEAQARQRLGWVMPGEVGYRVIGADGQIIGGTDVTAPAADEPTDQVWYEVLWSSLRTADQPVPVETAAPQPSQPATIGPDDPPSGG